MLKYTGGGYNGTRPEIPVRDLTDKEAEEFGGEEFLVSTGLYEKVRSIRCHGDRKVGKARKSAEVKHDED